MPKKTRRNIPKNTADQVMHKADMLCCVCRSRGDQIHHIDEDPDNNDIENLVYLCFHHHHEASVRGGLRRKLTPGVLQLYRDDLYKAVAARRVLPKPVKKSRHVSSATYDDLFLLVLDAVTIRKIEHSRLSTDFDDAKSLEKFLDELSIYTLKSGFRARCEIIDVASRIAHRLTFVNSTNLLHLARQIGGVTYEALSGLSSRGSSTKKLSAEEVELITYGKEVGVELAYGGARYSKNLYVVDAGGELLWKILYDCRMHNMGALKAEVLDDFSTAIEAAKREGFSDAKVLLELYRDHGLNGDSHYPSYPMGLADKIYAALK